MFVVVSVTPSSRRNSGASSRDFRSLEFESFAAVVSIVALVDLSGGQQIAMRERERSNVGAKNEVRRENACTSASYLTYRRVYFFKMSSEVYPHESYGSCVSRSRRFFTGYSESLSNTARRRALAFSSAVRPIDFQHPRRISRCGKFEQDRSMANSR